MCLIFVVSGVRQKFFTPNFSQTTVYSILYLSMHAIHIILENRVWLLQAFLPSLHCCRILNTNYVASFLKIELSYLFSFTFNFFPTPLFNDFLSFMFIIFQITLGNISLYLGIITSDYYIYECPIILK